MGSLMYNIFSLFYIMRLVFVEGRSVSSCFPDYLDQPKTVWNKAQLE